MGLLDWSQCSAVEGVPGKVSGAREAGCLCPSFSRTWRLEPALTTLWNGSMENGDLLNVAEAAGPGTYVEVEFP